MPLRRNVARRTTRGSNGNVVNFARRLRAARGAPDDRENVQRSRRTAKALAVVFKKMAKEK